MAFPVVGGVSDPRPITQEWVDLAKKALTQLDPTLVLIQVLQVRQQVVAGMLYFFKLEVRNPRGGGGGEGGRSEEEVLSCRVWDQPWTGTFEVTREGEED